MLGAYLEFYTVSSQQPKRLGDLTSAHRVFATCEPCRRSELLNVRALIDRYGAKVPIAWFRRILRCTRCGSRSAELRVEKRRSSP
jgi:hypothetical protein